MRFEHEGTPGLAKRAPSRRRDAKSLKPPLEVIPAPYIGLRAISEKPVRTSAPAVRSRGSVSEERIAGCCRRALRRRRQVGLAGAPRRRAVSERLPPISLRTLGNRQLGRALSPRLRLSAERSVRGSTVSEVGWRASRALDRAPRRHVGSPGDLAAPPGGPI